MLQTFKRLLAGRWSTAHGRPNMPTVASDPTVTELSRKLLGGFSLHARKDLQEIVSAATPRAQKSLAAWELAKFDAFESRWHDSLQNLEVIREVDESFLGNEGAGPLYIEALIACGRSDEAERYVHQMDDSDGSSADYHCALSNVIASQIAREKETVDYLLTRLALLNDFYRGANLAKVILSDSSRGFVFGNLAVAEGCLSVVHRPQKISVLMTVFNAEPSLSIAVSSVLNQTWHNFELVIVDDASTDGSWELIKHFASEDRRIVRHQNATNMGAYLARNKALALATGDFITVHDSAHWAHPQMLRAQIESMLQDPEVKLSLPAMASVSPDMKYALGMSHKNVQYICMSGRAYLVRKPDLQRLGKWDGVAAGGDEEFLQRAGQIWGDKAFREILPGVPMLLGLRRSPASGFHADASYRSPMSGARHEYAKQAEFWRKNVLVPANDAGRSVAMERISTKRPFPIPRELAPRHWPRNQHYDVIIISDLTLLGGTRRCNEGYIAAAANLEMKVGLLHWARYDLRLSDDIAKEYRLLSYGENVDILTADDRVSADLVLIHHPPIMKRFPDAVPRIDTKKLAILVNQLPQRFGTESTYYERRDVEADCSRLFGVAVVWIPISPLVRRVLSESAFAPLAREDWIPPLGDIVDVACNARSPRTRQRRNPVIGRHSRDHVTKWPEVEKDLRTAYCADSQSPVRFLGGTESARKVLTRWPENWEDLAFDSMIVSDFLNDLDFFLHFTHSGYIEEFGRNIMEAMAAGVPAILPPRFREVFGEAACYTDPGGVEDLVHTLWGDESAYLGQVNKGLSFVRELAGDERVEHRLRRATHGVI